MSLTALFGRPRESIRQMHEGLKARAAEMGLPMDPPSTLFNTHGALLLAEYATDMGKAADVHRQLFRVNFVDGRNLADPAVLREVAEQVGLDSGAAMAALKQPEYEERIRRCMAEARAYRVTGAPTFIVDDRYRIVGAQAYPQFVAAFQRIQQMHP